jgi:hypothetical protein
MGDELMLETANERILLLKAGITGKQIEELYISLNNFEIAGYHKPGENVIIDINKFNIDVRKEATA